MRTRSLSPAHPGRPPLARTAARALAAAALALLLLTVATSAADGASARRCPKHTVAARARSGQRTCVPRRAVSPLTALERLLPKPAKRAKLPSAASKRIAQRAVTLAVAQAQAGRALLDAGRRPQRSARARARAAAGENVGVVVSGIGEVTDYERAPSGEERIRFQHDSGVEVTLRGVEGGRWEAETRDRNGAGWTIGTSTTPAAPSCPTAAGDVPTAYRTSYAIGRATVLHGKRTWFRADLRTEGSWHGYVGVGARAERFDVDVRGVSELRGGVEIAATGKLLRREPTRTYRSVLRKRGIAMGTDPVSLAREVTLRGPKGTRYTADDVKPATALLSMTLDVVGDADSELEKGDRRWYDERRCARVDHTSTPERVVKGGRADWDVTAYGADGAIVADARWTPTSACGALTASGTSGPKIHLGVVDSDRRWGVDTGNGACARAELTTTAGRPEPFSHAIAPEPRRRLKLAITVRHTRTMGPGIAETHMSGTGEVLLGDETTVGQTVDGTGRYQGVEWDGTVVNSCAHDMLRTRDFAGEAAVGAQRNDDGTITVAFTAVERPFEMAWIVTLPERGGTQLIEGRQPFCGEPGRARTTTVFTVDVTELVDDGW